MLRNIQASEGFSAHEVDRMRSTLLARDDAEMKDNVFVINLLTHLQAPDVPLKTIDLLRDMPTMIQVGNFVAVPLSLRFIVGVHVPVWCAAQ